MVRLSYVCSIMPASHANFGVTRGNLGIIGQNCVYFAIVSMRYGLKIHITFTGSSKQQWEPTCVQQLCGVGKATMLTVIAASSNGSPQGTPAMWGR